jgi:hypothetical protein
MKDEQSSQAAELNSDHGEPSIGNEMCRTLDSASRLRRFSANGMHIMPLVPRSKGEQAQKCKEPPARNHRRIEIEKTIR